MSKQKKNSLGRSLIKHRFSKKEKRIHSLLHSSDLNDGYDWGRLNLQSVTKEDSFQEFLSTAQLAGTEFQAEKLNIAFVNSRVNTGLLTREEKRNYERKKEENKEFLKIPKRPKWKLTTTRATLHKAERDAFLEWRRSLAVLQEEKEIKLTPYEKNLKFWRELWRVVERSDVVVQILDARNPLLFRCEDLEKYVKEVDSKKMNMLLINKSDFLSERQRRLWAEYFTRTGVVVAFFSAKATLDNVGKNVYENMEKYPQPHNDPVQEECGISIHGDVLLEDILDNLYLGDELGFKKISSRLLGRNDLIELFRSFFNVLPHLTKEYITIGLVGYPNVGKSSTINALLADKRVSVSATPGKTKHFQTLYVTEDILLCDSPGLVMPSFVSCEAELVLNGILPIDHMRDHVSPTALLASLIPRRIIESEYGIMIPKPPPGESPTRPPTSEELLNAYAFCRGFMTQNGQPDNPRAARHVLKDFTVGRLLYCVAPPGIDQEKFNEFKNVTKKPVQLTALAARAIQPFQICRISDENFDSKYFCGAHKKGVQKIFCTEKVLDEKVTNGKPWKNHKTKRNRKEKLRKVYRYLDE